MAQRETREQTVRRLKIEPGMAIPPGELNREIPTLQNNRTFAGRPSKPPTIGRRRTIAGGKR